MSSDGAEERDADEIRLYLVLVCFVTAYTRLEMPHSTLRAEQTPDAARTPEPRASCTNRCNRSSCADRESDRASSSLLTQLSTRTCTMRAPPPLRFCPMRSLPRDKRQTGGRVRAQACDSERRASWRDRGSSAAHRLSR